MHKNSLTPIKHGAQRRPLRTFAIACGALAVIAGTTGCSLESERAPDTASEMTEESTEQSPSDIDEDSQETDEQTQPDPDEMPEPEPDLEPEPTTYTSIVLDTSSLSTLAGGTHYEGWAIIDGQPVSTGKFNVDASGVPTDLSGIAIPDARFAAGRDLSVASEFVITIESPGDNDIRPSDIKYLAGSLEGTQAQLTVSGGSQAFATDFTEARGSFILATPTNDNSDDELSGIWWLDLSVSPPAPGLELPELPDGWVYEGWSVIDGQPVSTGRFRAPDERDDSAIHSGPMDGPPVPGEDFLYNAPQGLEFPLDLSGTLAVITIEPEPDDSAEPFHLKPLVAAVPDQAADHQVFRMDNQAEATFPIVSVSLAQ